MNNYNLYTLLLDPQFKIINIIAMETKDIVKHTLLILYSMDRHVPPNNKNLRKQKRINNYLKGGKMG